MSSQRSAFAVPVAEFAAVLLARQEVIPRAQTIADKVADLLPETAVAGVDRAPAKRSLQPPSAAVPLLRKVIEQMEGDDGWVNLGEVGKRITNLFPDFDSRTYGHGKLSDLVAKSGSFEVDRQAGRALRIRLKQQGRAKSSKE